MNKYFLRLAAVQILLAGIVLGVPSLGGGTVSADPPNSVLSTVKYCKSKMPNNLDKLCTEGNMNRLRSAFQDDCKGKNQDACIENHAEDAIDQMAKKNPKNANDFNDALNAAIKAGGGANGGNGGNQGNGNSVSTTIDQSDISAGSLPKPLARTSTVKTILEIFFGIIGAFAVLSITLSGLKYVTSAGDAQKTSEAKKGIAYALIGLAVAITAEALIAFVVTGASS